MRQLLFLATIFILASCNSTDYTLNVTADVDDDNSLYLIVLDDNNQPQTLDTLYIKNGIASYTNSIEVPEMHFLLLEGNRDVVPVVIEPGKISVEIYKDSIRSSKASGTKSNKDFRRYINESTPIIEDLFSIQNEMRNAMISRDSLSFVDLQEQLSEMQTKFTDFQVGFIKSNADSFVSALILEQLVINSGISKEEAITLFDAMNKSVKKTKSGIKINDVLYPKKEEIERSDEDKEGVSVGDIAPDFMAPNVNGTSQDLYTSLGKYTILDFWASWCGPCRVDSPNLVKVHNSFKEKGLSIFSVSLDKDEKSWKKAIDNDKLNWDHVSNLMRWDDPIAAQYGVTSIPQLFLLDESGNVIAKERHATDFLPLLEELL